ncbi:putative secreted protein [Corynebacterium resistens DSM 45100]|uniref:Secreted protein n=1 Tax=Corynebacterium resistens (strain DSM 45100 / JCM 12819 / GTC 2026 / SICGH 158) TaxID=662755 RepID=F8DXW7_CORRG|nr:hypothetical protein [Corynebacterium resistens]AEI08764.1 putative secreted protein [Corynebacterium resistens DSM 45100]
MKTFKIATATLAASCLLVACGSEKQNEPAQAPAPSSEPAGKAAAEKPKYDHGPYFPEYRKPFKNMTSLEGGNAVESNVIADANLLGYEIDPSLVHSRGSRHIYGTSYLTTLLGTNYRSALDDMKATIQSGHYHTSENEKKDRQFISAIIRFDSAKTAKAVAEKLHQISITQGSVFASQKDIAKDPKLIDPKLVDTDLPFKDRPNTLASKGKDEGSSTGRKEKASLQTYTTHNEFVVYTWGQGSPKEFEKTKRIATDYLRKQIPLLDTIPTHKTKAGFGKLKGWTPTDKRGLLRYAVTTPVGGNAPQIMGERKARGYASTQTRPDVAMKAFDLSGIEYIGNWQTSVAQAQGEESAKTFQNAYVSTAVDLEDASKYDEPQKLPNTSCFEMSLPSGGGVECVMVYEDKVALGSQGFVNKPNVDSSVDPNGDKKSADSDKDKFNPRTVEDAKKLLSQKMAAQYLIFENAKKNPEGSVPPSAESVDPNKKDTSEDNKNSNPAGRPEDSESGDSTSDKPSAGAGAAAEEK